jgi:hypothetical protein
VNRIVSQLPVVSPRVSVVLLDWSVRESFHCLRYLNQQRAGREDYELIWIEYYGRRPEELAKSLDQESPTRLDQWVVLGMPENCYYHKHMMYNIGIAVSRGDVVCICDSDAMFSDTFIDAIIAGFAESGRIVLHMDEVRNNDKKFYPFNYPSVSEVLGRGAVNWRDGKTIGVSDTVDPLHTRNYGACFCARRDEIIAIGGADEYIGFVGHVCGPYDMTFRLVNNGCREVWDATEYLYHVWHPGQAGDQNLVGPHDGRHISTIALSAAKEGRIMPLKENAAIAALRMGGAPSRATDVVELAVDPSYRETLVQQQLERMTIFERWQQIELVASLKKYRYNLVRFGDIYYAVPWRLGELDAEKLPEIARRSDVFSGATEDAVREQVARHRALIDILKAHPIIRRSGVFFRKLVGTVERLLSSKRWSSGS